MIRRAVISIALALGLALVPHTCFAIVEASQENATAIKDVPLAPEKAVSTYLPSEAAPGQGLAVTISYPDKPRFKDGAPVVALVPGGDSPNGLTSSMHAPQVGCVEVRFAFPGGGIKGFQSSGRNDYRGKDSQKALRDIILFAMGKLEDYKERTIKDLIPIKVASDNIGIVGWSNGGNIALVTMDKFSDDLQGIGWIAFYETPLGSLYFPPCLGGKEDLVINKHYREGSGATGHCLIDFRRLAWDGETLRNPGVRRKRGEPELRGVLFFDDNENGHWEEPKEYAFRYLIDQKAERDRLGERNPGAEEVVDAKQIYPPEVTAAMDRLKAFKTKPDPATGMLDPNAPETSWPGQVAIAAESEAFFQERDGSIYLPSVAQKYPNLFITIYGSRLDHLQRQPDHPHILSQYNAWLDANAHWVRLNPESIYISTLANMSMRNFPNNKPNGAVDADSPSALLEPETVLAEWVFMDATIAELSDRKKSGNVSSPLEAPLCGYTSGAPKPVGNKSMKAEPEKDESDKPKPTN